MAITFMVYQFSSVTQLCPTLCNPRNRSMPGLPVHYQLPQFTQGSSQPRDQTQFSRIAGRILYQVSHQGRPWWEQGSNCHCNIEVYWSPTSYPPWAKCFTHNWLCNPHSLGGPTGYNSHFSDEETALGRLSNSSVVLELPVVEPG